MMRSEAFMWVAGGLITALSHVARTGRAVLPYEGRFFGLRLESRAALLPRVSFSQATRTIRGVQRAAAGATAVRFVMSALRRLFERCRALCGVEPDTFIRSHRNGLRLFWRWRSRPRAVCGRLASFGN
jgi:hypothetical protein